VSHGTVQANSPNRTLDTLKDDIMAELRQEKPNMTKLAEQFGIGRTTLYKHLRTLAEQGEVVKNGNGYEAVK
jgi:transcriptional regulator of acetoin/glycerol metabolism